jgi:dTDP-4-dehydrorhamnose reductase
MLTTEYAPKLLITGGKGQIATALANHPLASKFTLILCDHEELDITQPSSIDKAITKYLPDIIINTAAYTNTDKAEEEVSLADHANHIGAGHLALLCHKNQIKLLHLSTDYIFDGQKNSKYFEDDEANPINMYGKSKWQGEKAISNACPNHIILRVSAVFSEYGNNFLKNILQLARERTTLSVVSDQINCPTYAGDIAHAILTMCQSPSHKGTYHFCSDESISWYEFAKTIITEAKLHETLSANDVKPIAAAEKIGAAKRPALSVLDCQKIKMTFNISQPSWRDAVKQVIHKLIREKA